MRYSASEAAIWGTVRADSAESDAVEALNSRLVWRKQQTLATPDHMNPGRERSLQLLAQRQRQSPSCM